ncbi:hypothetical protein ES705_34034 [subsurface metagenome]
MSVYQVLSQENQDDIIVSFMLSQERDKYCLELNLERYTVMLKTLGAGKWRDQVVKLQAESTSRLAEVDSIIEASKAQMPPPGRLAATEQRLAVV